MQHCERDTERSYTKQNKQYRKQCEKTCGEHQYAGMQVRM
jgi:hypothetical protein